MLLIPALPALVVARPCPSCWFVESLGCIQCSREAARLQCARCCFPWNWLYSTSSGSRKKGNSHFRYGLRNLTDFLHITTDPAKSSFEGWYFCILASGKIHFSLLRHLFRPKTRKWPFPFDATNFKTNKKTQAVSSVWAVGSSFYAALFSGNFEVNAVIPNFLNVALISSIAHI